MLLIGRLSGWALIRLAAVSWILSAAIPAWSGPGDKKPVIVFDPGHGGQDTGARGPEGGFEKDLALFLAKRIAAQLGNGYHSVLTRKDDYPVDLDARTGAANHLQADLFICLHAQGGLRSASNDVLVLGYHEIDDDRLSPGAAPVPADAAPFRADEWEARQLRHLDASRALAAEVEKQLTARLPGMTVHLADAPLAVLAGADMSAIFIEAGGLTVAADRDPEGATQRADAFVQGVAAAITAFLSRAGR